MLTAQVETLATCLLEIQPILPLHWAELAMDKDKVPLSPQWHAYAAREAAGEFLVVTLREAGKIAGYFWGFVAPGLHYSTCLTCNMDIFYVHPEFRNRRGEMKLFAAVEKELKRRGVQRWFVGCKLHRDASALFRRLGFSPVEIYHSKWLGD